MTANKQILQAEAQRSLWIQENVGVFLSSGQLRAIDLLRLVLRKLDWLDAVDRTEKIPLRSCCREVKGQSGGSSTLPDAVPLSHISFSPRTKASALIPPLIHPVA
jgi:hypothetical protein